MQTNVIEIVEKSVLGEKVCAKRPLSSARGYVSVNTPARLNLGFSARKRHQLKEFCAVRSFEIHSA